MLKAGSILYALLIAAIVTMLSASVIYISHYNTCYSIRFYQIKDFYQQVYNAIYLGISGEMSSENLLVSGSTPPVYCTSSRMYWGAYELVQASVTHNNIRITKTALCGTRLPTKKQIPWAMYISNTSRNPLYISGKTHIEGFCATPKKGVHMGIMENNMYTGTSPLVKGYTEISEYTIPKLNPLLEAYTLEQYENIAHYADTVLEIGVSGIPDSTFRSFADKPIIFSSTEVVDLSSIVISGNIIVHSSVGVRIDQSAQLENILIVSPYVKIHDNFSGIVHILAADSVRTGENVQLRYPSSIVLINRHTTAQQLHIGKKNLFEGPLIISGKAVQKEQPLLSIEKETLVKGQVYSTGYVQLKGNIHGNVFCKSFFLKTSFSTYENYLLDVEIAPGRLSEFFLGVPVVEQENYTNNIVKWLP